MMSASPYSRRGGTLRALAWVVGALGAAVLVAALFTYKGSDIQAGMQEELDKTSERLKGKFDLPKLPDLPKENKEGVLGEPEEVKAPEGDPAKAAKPEEPEADPTEPTEPAKPNGAHPAPQVPKTAGKPKAPAYTLKNPPPVARARHRVTKGETLYSLAETYYEDGSLWKLIAEANNIKKPADLKAGATITIPGR